MKSFIKAYISTVVLINLISIGFNLFIFRDSLSTILYLFFEKWHRAAIFSGTLLVLMVVIGLPFFSFVIKHRNFSSGPSILMWLIISMVASFIIQLSKGRLEFGGSLWGFLLVSVVLGLIFSAFYALFKKRDKPVSANLVNIFR